MRYLSLQWKNVVLQTIFGSFASHVARVLV
uniref:Uncharacterized protein n=1 Tax=Arundo donax TaxID=35708 RepID=A0A0A9G6C8_ARUDO